MRKLLRSLLVGSILVALVIAARAADEAKPAGAKKAPPTRAKMECEIVSVDEAAKTIEVKVGDATQKLALTAKCKVVKDAKDATLTDLKAGEKCVCIVHDRPKEGGKSVSRIVVGEDKPKPEKKKKTKDE